MKICHLPSKNNANAFNSAPHFQQPLSLQKQLKIIFFSPETWMIKESKVLNPTEFEIVYASVYIVDRS